MEKTQKEAVMSPKPLVILVHEIYGVNSHMKKMGRLIKMAGYDVLTTNLLGEDEVYTLQEEKRHTNNLQNTNG